MTFNDNAKIDSSRVSRRGRNTGIAVGGGGGLLVIGLFIVSQLLGVDLTGLAGGTTTEDQGQPITQCDTGAQANASIDCLMGGASDSLDTYWASALPTLGATYQGRYFFADFCSSRIWSLGLNVNGSRKSSSSRRYITSTRFGPRVVRM